MNSTTLQTCHPLLHHMDYLIFSSEIHTKHAKLYNPMI